jgi:hypothetical protein
MGENRVGRRAAFGQKQTFMGGKFGSALVASERLAVRADHEFLAPQVLNDEWAVV